LRFFSACETVLVVQSVKTTQAEPSLHKPPVHELSRLDNGAGAGKAAVERRSVPQAKTEQARPRMVIWPRRLIGCGGKKYYKLEMRCDDGNDSNERRSVKW